MYQQPYQLSPHIGILNSIQDLVFMPETSRKPLILDWTPQQQVFGLIRCCWGPRGVHGPPILGAWQVQSVSSLKLQRDSFPIKAGENSEQNLSSVEVGGSSFEKLKLFKRKWEEMKRWDMEFIFMKKRTLTYPHIFWNTLNYLANLWDALGLGLRIQETDAECNIYDLDRSWNGRPSALLEQSNIQYSNL